MKLTEHIYIRCLDTPEDLDELDLPETYRKTEHASLIAAQHPDFDKLQANLGQQKRCLNETLSDVRLGLALCLFCALFTM